MVTNAFHGGQDVRKRQHIRIFRVEVQKALLMCCVRTVTHRLADDNGSETGLTRIHGSGPYTATCRAARDDKRIVLSDRLGRSARKQRNCSGTEITHYRTNTGGMTRSTRCSAVCAIRRPLQENAMTKPCPHEAQRALPNPKQRMPQGNKTCQALVPEVCPSACAIRRVRQVSKWIEQEVRRLSGHQGRFLADAVEAAQRSSIETEASHSWPASKA